MFQSLLASTSMAILYTYIIKKNQTQMNIIKDNDLNLSMYRLYFLNHTQTISMFNIIEF